MRYAVVLKDTTFDGCVGRIQTFHRSFRAAEAAMVHRQQQVRDDGPGVSNYLPLTVVALKAGIKGYRHGEYLRNEDTDQSCVVGGG